MTFSTPVTPTRERLNCTDGGRACTSIVGRLVDRFAVMSSKE
jgi:hypothetical protein